MRPVVSPGTCATCCFVWWMGLPSCVLRTEVNHVVPIPASLLLLHLPLLLLLHLLLLLLLPRTRPAATAGLLSLGCLCVCQFPAVLRCAPRRYCAAGSKLLGAEKTWGGTCQSIRGTRRTIGSHAVHAHDALVVDAHFHSHRPTLVVAHAIECRLRLSFRQAKRSVFWRGGLHVAV